MQVGCRVAGVEIVVQSRDALLCHWSIPLPLRARPHGTFAAVHQLENAQWIDLGETSLRMALAEICCPILYLDRRVLPGMVSTGCESIGFVTASYWQADHSQRL